jgi:hypothetical protein
MQTPFANDTSSWSNDWRTCPKCRIVSTFSNEHDHEVCQVCDTRFDFDPWRFTVLDRC